MPVSIASHLHVVYHETMKKDYSMLLKKAGLKVTPARELVLAAFSTDCGPINAEFIHQRSGGKDINLVTIYRTLASLEAAGIIKRVDLQRGSAYYELAEHHHHHLVCTGCGTVEGFEGCGIEVVATEALKGSRFRTVSGHSLELFGTCKKCG